MKSGKRARERSNLWVECTDTVKSRYSLVRPESVAVALREELTDEIHALALPLVGVSELEASASKAIRARKLLMDLGVATTEVDEMIASHAEAQNKELERLRIE